MRKRTTSKILSLLLAACMLFSLFPVSIFAEDTDSATWAKTTLDEITSEDTVAITMTKGDTTWVLPTTGGGSQGQPLAVTGTVDGDTLTTGGYASALGWAVTKSDEGCAIRTRDGSYLYLDSAGKNNSVRIGSTSASWTVDEASGYLTALDTAGTQRYLGIYIDNNSVAQDWRAYTNTTGNIANQTLNFWKLTSAPEEPEEPTISTVAEALAASSGTFTVKGVVTLVDGRNVYVQDATGGICLFFAKAPSGIALGDTVIGTGSRTTYNGLPELSGATFENSEGLTLAARETTIGELTTADICTYVTIKDLTVTAVSGTTVTVEDSTNSIQIYKAVLGETELAAGNTIDFTGAVGIYNSTLQLRNTDAAEIIKTGSTEPEEPEYVTIAEALAGETDTSFTVKGVVTMVDGTNIYVQDATGGICLYFAETPSGITLGDTIIGTGTRATFRGLPELSSATFVKSKGLTLTAKESTIGALTTADICTYVQLKDLEVTEVYDKNGTYANPNVTLKDADNKTIQIYKAVVGKTDGVWDLAVGDTVSVKAAVGVNNTTLQLRNTVATEITKASDDPYPEVEATKNVYELTAALADGDVVLIYNAGNTKALTSVIFKDYYLEGKDFTSQTVSENRIIAATPNEAATSEWTVKVNEDGTYTFIQGENTLAGKQVEDGSRIHNNLTLSAEDNVTWALTECNEENHSFYVYNPTMTSKYESEGGKIYLEWYAKSNDFSLYDTSTISEGAFGMTFFKLVRPATETPVEPEGESYGLSSTLATGDKVILYNAGSGMGVGNTLSGYKIAGVALAPTDGVITTADTSVVWTVTVNADNTLTFTQDGYTLGGVVSGSYNNLVVTGATSTSWTPTGPNASDFTYFLRLDDLSNSNGKMYLEYYSGFTLYGSSAPTAAAYGIQFYKQGAEPEIPDEPVGDLVTNLSQLTDGTTVAIYSPTHQTAVSSKPNGDWYLKANAATIEEGKVVNFTTDYVWKVKVNDNGTYSFYSNNDETQCISVWPSGTYAELTVNPDYNSETVHDWNLLPFSADNHTWYIKNSTLTIEKNNTALPVYIEAYKRNDTEVFSGYAPYSNQLTSTDYALQFYLVNPDDALVGYDDGEWDKVLEKGKQYVIYNAEAGSSLGLQKEATYSLTAVPTTIENNKAKAGNGAYVFTVDSMGRYYSFEVNGKLLATNNAEELFFADKNEDGSAPENAKWFLTEKDNGYFIYNKDASYGGTPVCIEYFSSVFSGWTYSPKNDINIYLFKFFETADGTEIRDGIVQDPSVVFDCEDFRYVEQDYTSAFSLDDLAPSIESIQITYTAGTKTGTVTEYEASPDGKGYSFTIPADDIDQPGLTEFTITVTVNNSYGIQYTGEKTVEIIDLPFFEDLTPAPNAQTRDDKRPVISAKVGNVGDAPTFTMTINGQTVHPVFENGVLSYTPTEDLADGRTTVVIKAVRADGKEAEKSWTFIVGTSGYQLYFGQLHSHTTYSDGSGSLDTALDYIASLPESANVQFVAFTDHSNYFDTTSAANPADALNDKSLMTDASRALWEEYKSKVASFNEKQEGNLLAVAGFEMTWSGGPGHINTFDSDGLVSRNNAALNSKTGDAGMKLYYETINKGDSLNQFNHPGSTFGNFTDFSYWDEETDAHMFLVEVGNGEGQIGAGGYYPSYEQYILALDKGWHVAPTNNQDNHKGRWGNANDARDVILTNDFSEAGIYDAIRNLRVYATEDKNLQITYTVNGESMGTIFTDENAPEKLNIEVTLYDPDAADSITKVELVGNGGAVAHTWDNAAELANGDLTVELDPEYSYYFVRVTQKDGDLAVTAPVWVGKALKLGITDIKSQAEPVYKGEETTLVTTFYNNEEQAATVKSLVYSVGGTVIGTDTTGYTISADGTLAVNFTHTFNTAKLTTVEVAAVIEFNGKEGPYTATVELDVIDKATENTVTSIADVRAASDPNDTGYRFVIEGVVTSNASGYDKDTAFFDCIYVQDDTAGICCFPVSGEFKIGDKVHIVGHTDFYQSEPELQVQTIEIIGSGSVEPTEITAAQLNDRSAEGKLVTIKGTVESFELANGLIQTIMVKDAAGGLARVFIDGYITTAKDVENCIEGASITVTGLASYDDTFNAPDGPFPRIRIRDRADVICAAAGYQIIVENYAGEKAVTSLTEGASYSGEVAFTVTCDETCLVAVKNADGTYTVLPCTDADGAHTFTVTVADADVTLAIALKGDADLNGAVETKDATLVKQMVLGTATFEVAEALQRLAGDAFPDGKLSAKDATAIKQVVLGTRTLAW